MSDTPSNFDLCLIAISTRDLKALSTKLSELTACADADTRVDLASLLLHTISLDFAGGVAPLLQYAKSSVRPLLNPKDFIDLLDLSLAERKLAIAEMLLGNCPFPELNWEVKRLRAVSTAALDGLEELFKSKSFTQAMLSLLICSGLNSELPEFKDRKSFVLLSLEADRPDLLELLLKYGASALADIMSDNGKRSCAYNIAIQRGRMECLELIRLKHVIPINGYCYAHQPALASLVESEHLSESEMITVAAKLLGWGAHPLRKRHGHQDAPTIARARGLNKIARFLEENYSMYGPAYVREARKRKIKDLCLHYNKANGLIFRIADFDFPFFVGGDYDGAYPTTAKDAWSIATKEGGDSNFTCVEWFLPFLERIAAGQEISFDSLMKFQSRFSIYTDEQPSNWD